MALDYPEEHRRPALLVTLGVHALLALLFFFVVFRGPDPPLTDLGGTGVELNYGIDEAGSGDLQSSAPANASPNREDTRPPAQAPDPQPQPVAAAPVPTPPAEEKLLTSEAEESPVSAPPVETPAPPKEEVRETPRPPRKVAVTFTPKGSAAGGGNGVNGTSTAPTGNNNGDRPGSVGDQGDPRGTLNGAALYGNPGKGGNGAGGSGGDLDLVGWAFEVRPSVAAVDNISFAGTMKYKIRIDENGTVTNVVKVAGNMSQEQDRLCKQALSEANFRPTSSSQGAATGFYTFRFAAK